MKINHRCFWTFIVPLALFAAMIIAGCGPKLTQKDSSLARVFLDTAKSNLVNGECGNAESEAKKSIDKNPRNAEAYRILALAYYCEGKNRSAIQQIKIALDMEPRNGDFHNDLGGFYMKDQRLKEAREEFQKALDDKSFNAPAASLYNIAETYRLAGNMILAIQKYRESLDRDPNQDRPYYWQGIYKLQEGKTDEAAALFNDSVKMNPNNFDAWMELCRLACSQQNGKMVKTNCETFLSTIPENYSNQENLSKARQCLHDMQ
jgi:Tfp pilus assembly protein PilF